MLAISSVALVAVVVDGGSAGRELAELGAEEVPANSLPHAVTANAAVRISSGEVLIPLRRMPCAPGSGPARGQGPATIPG